MVFSVIIFVEKLHMTRFSGRIKDITVFPFVLRGISLIGTGASETSMHKRKEIWSKLAGDWKLK